MQEKGSEEKKKSFFKWVFKSKSGIFLVVVPVSLVVLFGSHEIAVSYFPQYVCISCHEMKEPVRKWKESGAAKSHPNCAGCHFDTGIRWVWDMNKRAAQLFVLHFKRDPNEEIKPAPEPLFLDQDKEPGYYSYVPNHRCFQCKNAKNHREMDMQKVHSKLIKDISKRPCRDCHNHEMRKGQKFYEQVLPDKDQARKNVQFGGPIGPKMR